MRVLFFFVFLARNRIMFLFGVGALAFGASGFGWDSSGPMEKEACGYRDWLAGFDLTFLLVHLSSWSAP